MKKKKKKNTTGMQNIVYNVLRTYEVVQSKAKTCEKVGQHHLYPHVEITIVSEALKTYCCWYSDDVVEKEAISEKDFMIKDIRFGIEFTRIWLKMFQKIA